jgi:hypothetical protein
MRADRVSVSARTREATPRAASFSATATASSRSATTASASNVSAFCSLRSSLPGAKRSERRGERSLAVIARYLCQTFQGCQQRAVSRLDTLAKVRHKRSRFDSAQNREVAA